MLVALWGFGVGRGGWKPPPCCRPWSDLARTGKPGGIFALAGFNQLGVGVSWGKFDFRMIARAVADTPKSTINQRRSSIVNRSGHGAAGSWD
jgi:hypothetical protein